MADPNGYIFGTALGDTSTQEQLLIGWKIGLARSKPAYHLIWSFHFDLRMAITDDF